MFQLTQSSFLQALGYAIINSLWQFALLWLIYILLSGIFKFSSHQKYATGLVLQLGGFTWFVFTLVFYYNQLVSLVQTGGAVFYDYSIIETGHTTRESVYTWIMRTEQFLPYLSVAYLSLLVFLCLKWVHCYRYTQSIRTKNLLKIDVEWKLFVKQLSMQMGIKSAVSIYLSSLIKSPLTIGFFKPIILIPLASLNNLTSEQMEAVLLHELAHIKRYDYIVNLFLSIVESLLFFNPFMQLLSKNIKRERENSCDDWVLQYNYSATTYAKALLQIAMQQSTSSSPLFAMNATEDKQVLLNRVKRMIEKKERTYNYSHSLLAFLILTSILSLIAWFSPRAKPVENETANTKVIFEPLAAKIENPLFNPVFFLADKQENHELLTEEQRALDKKEAKNTVVHVNKLVLAAKEKIKPADEMTPHVVMKELIDAPISGRNLRRLEKHLDTLRFNTTFQAVLGTKFWNEVDKAQKEIRRITIADSKVKSLENEALVKEMQVAIEGLRNTKIHLLNGKTLLLAKTEKDAKALNTKALRLISKGKILKTQELKEITEDLQKEIEEFQGQYALFAALNESYLEPIKIYQAATMPAHAHVYSYDYHAQAATLPTAKRKVTMCTEVVESRTSSVIVGEPYYVPPAPAPAVPDRYKRTATKRLKIIKI